MYVNFLKLAVHTGLFPRVSAATMELIPGFRGFSLDFSDFYSTMLNVAVYIAIAVAITLVAAAGYAMMMSQGDATKIKEAKAQLQDAIMGMLLVILAASIIRIVFSLLHIGGVTIN